MNSSSCQKGGSYNSIENRLLPALYTITLVIGLVGNSWGLKALRQKWKKLENINVFILNLGLANILYLLTVPFLVAYYFVGRKWIFGNAFCKVSRFCFNLNLYCSIGFLTCISVYRHLAVTHPIRLKAIVTTSHSVSISVLIWVLVSAQSLPDVFFPKTVGNQMKCFHSTSSARIKDYLNYSMGWTVTGFCVPLLITLGCYGHLALIFCRRPFKNVKLKRRALSLMLISSLLFSVCYIPYHIFRNLSLHSRVLSNQEKCPWWDQHVFTGHQISRGLVCLNSALNPLIYLQMSENIHSELRRHLKGIRKICQRSFACDGHLDIADHTDQEAETKPSSCEKDTSL